MDIFIMPTLNNIPTNCPNKNSTISYPDIGQYCTPRARAVFIDMVNITEHGDAELDAPAEWKTDTQDIWLIGNIHHSERVTRLHMRWSRYQVLIDLFHRTDYSDYPKGENVVIVFLTFLYVKKLKYTDAELILAIEFHSLEVRSSSKKSIFHFKNL